MYTTKLTIKLSQLDDYCLIKVHRMTLRLALLKIESVISSNMLSRMNPKGKIAEAVLLFHDSD